MPTIKFADITGDVPEQFYPRPSKHYIPQWWKQLAPYEGDARTGKRCLPMIDAIMTGYMIVTTDDIKVSQEAGYPEFFWNAGNGIDFHNSVQMSTHPNVTEKPIPKWVSPWSIETPAGYSTLFIPPMNHGPLPFTIFSGLVDTDKHHAPVSLPFMLTPSDFEGVILAGTPLAQVIPIQREAWKSEVTAGLTTNAARILRLTFGAFKNAYRNYLRSPKSFE